MRLCRRLTQRGVPCRRQLQWHETACLYHATSDELWASIRKLRAATVRQP